jgi:hypothetical protein
MPAQIIGDEALKRKLRKLKDFRILLPAMKAGRFHIKGKVSKYPRSTAANTKGTQAGDHWYQRGWGSKWVRKDGTVGGNQSSEDHAQSWFTKSSNRGLTQKIGSDTTYGPYLQDPSKQTKVHNRIGWKTTDEIVDAEEQTVLNLFKKQVDKVLIGTFRSLFSIWNLQTKQRILHRRLTTQINLL